MNDHLAGSQLLVGLIGNPIAHSYSPRFQQAALDALGIPARYELWQTNAGELPARVSSLLNPQYLGANVTIPYKEAVLPLLDAIDPMAERIGAVNTIVRHNEHLRGYNTDVYGLLCALAEQGIGKQLDETSQSSVAAQCIAPLGVAESSIENTFSPHHLGGAIHRATTHQNSLAAQQQALTSVPLSLEGYTAVLLGAGGAARAAAFALTSASVTCLIIVNRHLERAQRLAADLGAQVASPATQIFSLSDPSHLIPHPLSLIINATPVGMHEDASPLPIEILARFAPGTLVFDMIYNPAETKLLCQARTLGLRAVNGLPMLLHQGALAFTLWTGQPAPLEVMRSALL